MRGGSEISLKKGGEEEGRGAKRTKKECLQGGG